MAGARVDVITLQSCRVPAPGFPHRVGPICWGPSLVLRLLKIQPHTRGRGTPQRSGGPGTERGRGRGAGGSLGVAARGRRRADSGAADGSGRHEGPPGRCWKLDPPLTACRWALSGLWRRAPTLGGPRPVVKGLTGGRSGCQGAEGRRPAGSEGQIEGRCGRCEARRGGSAPPGGARGSEVGPPVGRRRTATGTEGHVELPAGADGRHRRPGAGRVPVDPGLIATGRVRTPGRRLRVIPSEHLPAADLPLAPVDLRLPAGDRGPRRGDDRLTRTRQRAAGDRDPGAAPAHREASAHDTPRSGSSTAAGGSRPARGARAPTTGEREAVAERKDHVGSDKRA